jgi:hypothetical protein
LDRACYKLSNEYLFAKFGFINLWEIKFEISICNLFEINQTGGKIIKNESDRIRNELGPIPNKPERAGPIPFRAAGEKYKRGADRWDPIVRPSYKTRIGKLPPDQDLTADDHLLPQHGQELTCEQRRLFDGEGDA